MERDPWYASWFGEEYLALYPHRDDKEAEQQAAFAGAVLAPFASRGRIAYLDLACGTGRHAVALRTARGVVGLDLSAHLLAEARRRESVPVPGYVRGDMRRLPFAAGTFGAVVNFFTSFGYFERPEDDAAVLSEVARILVPGGAFLSDVFNATRVIGMLASREVKTIGGHRVVIRRRYDPATRRVEKEITMESAGEKRTFRERVRAYDEAELRALHRTAGLDVAGAYGDFDGSRLEPQRSPRLILLATKPRGASPA